jgi:competence protein ComEC
MPILKHRIFLIFLISFIFGIFLASFFKISYFLCYSFFLFCLPFLILFWENKRIRIVFLSFIFLLLGIIRYNLSWPKITPEKIQFYNNRKVVFEGIVKRVDERLDKKELVVKANKIFINEESIKIKGNVLVYLPLYSSYFYGDRLKISCHLLSPKPIEKFAYHEYLARYNIYSVCFPKEVEILARKQGNFFINQIFKIREKIKLAIDQNFTEPEGSVFSALLLGIKKEIHQRVREVFSKTGTAHILAVSGLHVMIMTKILIFILINLSLKRQDAFWIVSLFLIFYILLTGASPSAIRAGIMGFLLILAEKIGRKKESLNLIFFSAALMLLFNPKLLKNDIGFQLSYLGILGINYLENFFYRVFKSIFKKKTNLSQLLATTFSAQVFVFPLVLYYWGYLSLIAPIANFLVLNVLPYLMTLGFLFAFCSFIFLPLSKILFFPIWLILYFLFRILKFLSDLPVFSINFGQINFVMVIILYLAIIYFTFKAKTIK